MLANVGSDGATGKTIGAGDAGATAGSGPVAGGLAGAATELGAGGVGATTGLGAVDGAVGSPAGADDGAGLAAGGVTGAEGPPGGGAAGAWAIEDPAITNNVINEVTKKTILSIE